MNNIVQQNFPSSRVPGVFWIIVSIKAVIRSRMLSYINGLTHTQKVFSIPWLSYKEFLSVFKRYQLIPFLLYIWCFLWLALFEYAFTFETSLLPSLYYFLCDDDIFEMIMIFNYYYKIIFDFFFLFYGMTKLLWKCL